MCNPLNDERTCDMSARVQMIVGDMADYLDRDALKTIILNAIPEKQAREVQMGESAPRPEWPGSGSRGRVITVEAHEDAYTAEFPDDEALQYIDLIREVVSAQNPPKNAETRVFLLGEYATESAKTEGVPSDFQPILILFKKWCDLTPPAAHSLGFASDTDSNPPGVRAELRRKTQNDKELKSNSYVVAGEVGDLRELGSLLATLRTYV